MEIILYFPGIFMGWALGANDAANVFGTAVAISMLAAAISTTACDVDTGIPNLVMSVTDIAAASMEMEALTRD